MKTPSNEFGSHTHTHTHTQTHTANQPNLMLARHPAPSLGQPSRKAGQRGLTAAWMGVDGAGYHGWGGWHCPLCFFLPHPPPPPLSCSTLSQLSHGLVLLGWWSAMASWMLMRTGCTLSWLCATPTVARIRPRPGSVPIKGQSISISIKTHLCSMFNTDTDTDTDLRTLPLFSYLRCILGYIIFAFLT